MEKQVDIRKRFNHELLEIKYQIQLIREGRIYEISGVQGDGYAATRAAKLEEKIKDLLDAIEYDKPFHEELDSFFAARKEGSSEDDKE